MCATRGKRDPEQSCAERRKKHNLCLITGADDDDDYEDDIKLKTCSCLFVDRYSHSLPTVPLSVACYLLIEE